ncbi:MAG: methyltransferase domain-containing protein [Candidatus Riflebacteria bacterium]|nr:methyltransferase domain-containing protein [Candidatus Riflebacteria bacterium]
MKPTNELSLAVSEYYRLEALGRRRAPAGRSALYGPELDLAPGELHGLSFGCGSPLAQLDLHPGQRVLDVGCGAGLDLCIAARLVGPQGEVVGVDVTPEMAEWARDNVARAGLGHARVLEDDVAAVDLPDGLFDHVTANAALHLMPELDRALSRCRRLLGPMGTLAACDPVVSRPLPEALRDHATSNPALLLHGLLAPLDRYLDHFHRAGFESVEVRSRRPFSPHEALSRAVAACLPGPLASRVRQELAEVEFSVVTVLALVRVPRRELTTRCSCGALATIAQVDTIDGVRSPGLFAELIAGRLNRAACPVCHTPVPPPAPFLVIDHARRTLWHVFPEEARPVAVELEREAELFGQRWRAATGLPGFSGRVVFEGEALTVIGSPGSGTGPPRR